MKAAFLKWNSAGEKEEGANVSQFFHILDNVSMVRGSVVTASGAYDITTYSCCVNTRTGVYYYKTYDNSRSGRWTSAGRILREAPWRCMNWRTSRRSGIRTKRGQRI